MWRHNKTNKKRIYKGSYQKLRGERVFVLTWADHNLTFESWQMARKLGWSKINE